MILSIPTCLWCGWNLPIYQQDLSGGYVLEAIDTTELTNCYHEDKSAWACKFVNRYACNERFILLRSYVPLFDEGGMSIPFECDKSAHLYHIIDLNPSAVDQEHGATGIYGPLNAGEFEELKKALGVPADIEWENVPEF